MDLKSTIDIIIKDLKDARDIMDDMKNYPDVPEIQIELAKAKCRNAEEVLKYLTDIDLPSKENDNIISEEEIVTDPVIEEDIITDLNKKDNIDVFEISDFEDKAEEKVSDSESSNNLNKEAEIIDQIIQPGNIEKENETVDDTKQQGKIIADKFSKQSSINEQIANKRHDSDSAEVSKMKPVSNLSDAIGINDRFLFVRELFKGNQDLYNTTVNELNKAASLDQAFDILSQACKPDKDNSTFDLMLDLVKRKLRTQ